MRKISISQHISSKLPVHICVDKIKGSLRAEFRSATTAMTEDAALNFLLIVQILMVRQILIFLNQQTVDVSFLLFHVPCFLLQPPSARRRRPLRPSSWQTRGGCGRRRRSWWPRSTASSSPRTRSGTGL